MQKGPRLFCDICEKQLIGFTHHELVAREPGRAEYRHVCSECAIGILDFIVEMKEEWKNFNTTVQEAVTTLAEEVKKINGWVKRRELLMPSPQVSEYTEEKIAEAEQPGPSELTPNELPIIGESKQEKKDEEPKSIPPEQVKPSQEEGSGSEVDGPAPNTSPAPNNSAPEPSEPEAEGVSETRDPFQDEEDSGGPEEA